MPDEPQNLMRMVTWFAKLAATVRSTRFCASAERVSRVATVVVTSVAIGSLAGCGERAQLDGVWEVQSLSLGLHKWDTVTRRYVSNTTDLTEVDSIRRKASYLVLDGTGRIVNKPVEFRHTDTNGIRIRPARESGTALAEIAGTDERSGSDSTCGFLSFCIGDTLRIVLKRVGDRDGMLPANHEYHARWATFVYWADAHYANDLANETNLDWSVGESLTPTNADYTSRLSKRVLEIKQKFDSGDVTYADTAAVSYFREVSSLLGGMHAVASEMNSFGDSFAPGNVRVDAPGLGGVIARMKAYLRAGSASDAAIAARIPELVQRLTNLEDRAVFLRTREPQLQALLTRTHGVPFSPIGVFEPLRPSPSSSK